MSQPSKSLMVLVGDVSADRHIVEVIRRIKRQAPDVKIWGIGGECMAAEGVELMYHLKDFEVVGIVEVIKFIPLLQKMRAAVVNAIKERRPDLILMVDYGAFNLRVARTIKKSMPDQKILYFIAPQFWASRPWRLQTILDNVSKMLVIFPFEEPLLKRKGIDTRFVGHPIIKQLPDESILKSHTEFAASMGLKTDGEIIAVFPGSRKQEIRYHMPVVLSAIKELCAERPQLQFIISRADSRVSKLIDEICFKHELAELIGRNIFFTDGKANYDLLKNADLIWAKSGTTTLEVTMFGKPMIIFYRGNWLTYLIVMLYMTVKYAGLPNVLSGHSVVPELLQLDCRPGEFVTYTRDLLDVPGLRREISEKLLSLRQKLGEGDYVVNCVNEALGFLGYTKNSKADDAESKAENAGSRIENPECRAENAKAENAHA